MNDAPSAGLVVSVISQSYGSTKALTDVSLVVPPGKIVALVGHNGAGKSTLLRVLSGAEKPDQGTISVDGVVEHFSKPSDATAAGIACVYQELSLVDQLTVAQNVFLGREVGSLGVLSLREMNRATEELCARFSIAVRPTDLVSNISVAQRQMVEVARAISRGSKYLFLDEPTTALEKDQVDHLLKIVKQVAAEQNIGVLFVDHKLDEVFAIADHIVGLSNGRIVLDGPATIVDRAAVVDAVIGEESAERIEQVREGDTHVHRHESQFGDAVLIADRIAGPRLTDVSLRVRAGEVLGIYGLVGSGRTRFLRTVYGAESITSGTLTLNGQPYAAKSPREAIRRGIAFVSEERKFDGFIPQFSGQDNVVLPILSRFVKAGVLNWRRIHMSADEALSRVSIRGNVSAPIATLSGGNQQKALFAKAALQAPALLLLDEPTKGVDIGAKAEIYDIIASLARQSNVAVIVVSSEEEELITVADTISVFRSGTCDASTFANDKVTPSQLRQLAWADADRATA
jgi:ABC-type sugar transport system ATPase subunit